MTETIAIIDYESGNLRSVQKAVERAAADAGRSVRAVLAETPETVAAADRIILPGVGAFAACMAGLKDREGVAEALETAVRKNGRPFLGVCVGMQLLADRGLEFGETPGLGWIPGVVRRLPAEDAKGERLRAPHMGWNAVRMTRQHPVVAGLPAETDFYFAHSFYFDAEMNEDILGVCDYGIEAPAALARENMVAAQFHPEKSQAAGLALIAGFLAWKP